MSVLSRWKRAKYRIHCDNVIARNLISLSCFFAVYFYFSFRNQDKILQVESALAQRTRKNFSWFIYDRVFNETRDYSWCAHWGVVDTLSNDWPKPSILLAVARLSPNILIHYLSLSIKPQSFHEGEKPSLPGNFFSNPWHEPYPPTITNGRDDECEWSFSTFLIVFFLFAHFTLFSRQARPTYLPTLTAKKALATARHSFNLRITKRYPRQIPGLVLRCSYLHFSQRIIVFHISLYIYFHRATRRFCIIYAE